MNHHSQNCGPGVDSFIILDQIRGSGLTDARSFEKMIGLRQVSLSLGD